MGFFFPTGRRSWAVKYLLKGEELPGQGVREQGGLEQGKPYLLRQEAPS